MVITLCHIHNPFKRGGDDLIRTFGTKATSYIKQMDVGMALRPGGFLMVFWMVGGLGLRW